MAPIGSLWGVPIQRQTKAILAAAAIGGIEIDTPQVDFHVTTKSPEFLKKFPLGKIPAFEDNKGRTLVEGGGRLVSSFAPESGLLGKDAYEAALVDQWVHFAETEIAMFSYETNALVAGYLGPYSKKLHEISLQRQARALKFLDDHLASSVSGYLISDKLSLADIVIATVTEQAAKITLGAAERAQYANIFAHYEKVVTHPKLKEIFGKAEFVEEKLTYKGA